MIRDIPVIYSLLVTMGFLGWVGGTVAFIFRGLTDDDRLNRKPALFWGIFTVVFYTVWIIGLKLA